MQTACWQLWFAIVLRGLATRHASPPRFNPVEAGTPPQIDSRQVLHPHFNTLDRYNRYMHIPGNLLRRICVSATLISALAVTLAAAPMTRLNIVVKSQGGKPVDRASVVVRFVEGHS